MTLAATIHPELTDQHWADAATLIRGSKRIVLACHVSPDGDALGSTLALGIGLQRLGYDVVATHDTTPFRTPPSLEFLPGGDLLVAPAAIAPGADLVMTFDTGSLERLGAVAALIASATATVVVDHHLTNTRFGSHHLIDVTAASTTVLVTRLLDELGIEIDADIAACLYTGLVTDTGSFKYAATTPDVHLLAARLIETGIRHDLIARAVYDTARFAYVQLLGEALSRARLEGSWVWTSVSADDLRRHGLCMDEIEGVIDVIRVAEEAEVASVIKQELDGVWKVSMRSKGEVDVGELCESLGGGGHRFAAGFTSPVGLEGTAELVRQALATS